MDFKELQTKYNTCTKCEKCLNGTKVFGVGSPKAKIVVIGEGPGNEEIKQVSPFVGPAGQLLNQILSSVGIKREEIYLTNALLCRTNSSNRTPTKEEYSNCRPRLFEELSIVKPKFALLVGNTPLKSVFGDNCMVSQTHGQCFTLLDKPCYYWFSLYHPAWALHSINEDDAKTKRMQMWTDAKKVVTEMKAIEENIIGGDDG